MRNSVGDPLKRTGTSYTVCASIFWVFCELGIATAHIHGVLVDVPIHAASAIVPIHGAFAAVPIKKTYIAAPIHQA